MLFVIIILGGKTPKAHCSEELSGLSEGKKCMAFGKGAWLNVKKVYTNYSVTLFNHFEQLGKIKAETRSILITL